jgi:hypothetical protein
MIKQRSDEPDDKALERLREFEEKRRPVPDQENENDPKKKNKLPGKKQQQPGNKRDKATDDL